MKHYIMPELQKSKPVSIIRIELVIMAEHSTHQLWFVKLSAAISAGKDVSSRAPATYSFIDIHLSRFFSTTEGYHSD